MLHSIMRPLLERAAREDHAVTSLAVVDEELDVLLLAARLQQSVSIHRTKSVDVDWRSIFSDTVVARGIHRLDAPLLSLQLGPNHVLDDLLVLVHFRDDDVKFFEHLTSSFFRPGC